MFSRIFQRRKLYNDLNEELRQHLEERTEQLMREENLPRYEAEQAAKKAFGNPTLLEEQSRETWQWPKLESLWADAKYALRQMRKSPGLTVAIVSTLALGIGANTAIFTAFDQVLLRAMPVHEAGQLVLLREHSRFETGSFNSWGGDNDLYFSYPAYRALHDGNRVLSDLAVSARMPVSIVTPTLADRDGMQLVGGNYFSVLGLQPVLGRLLTPSDDRYHAANPVAVMSQTYWKSHFGSDPSVLNKTIQLNGSPVTVVGIVAHDGMMDSNTAAVFVPVSLENVLNPQRNRDVLNDPLNRWLNIVGRLNPGVTHAQAETQLNTFWWNWRRDVLNLGVSGSLQNKRNADAWLQTHLTVASGARGIPLLADHLNQPFTILETMSFVVLLIVCANVANLLLAKAARKYSELAMRAALGASRRRIFEQVLLEGLLFGLFGAVTGLAVAWLTLKLLAHMSPEDSTMHTAFSAAIGWHAILFSVAAGMLTSILFSAAPAFLSVRIDLLRALRRQGGAVTAGNGRMRSLLVVSQIALSLALLCCATTFAWNLYLLRNIHPGFDTTSLLTFRIDAAQQGESIAQSNDEYARIAEDARRLPGVRNVVYSMDGFLGGNETGGNITVLGYTGPNKDSAPDRNMVSPGFFSAMRIPMLAGREFTEDDMGPNRKIAIVDELFVKTFFDGDIRKAMSGQVGLGGRVADLRIVGVVPTVRANHFTSVPSTPYLYLPFGGGPVGSYARNYPASFYARTQGDPTALTRSVRDLIHTIDHNLPVTDMGTMQQTIDATLFDTRLTTTLSIAMGVLALGLAAIGLYGVLSFSVAQRSREIGIRMAMGAGRSSISVWVARRVIWMALAGTAAGILLGWIGVQMFLSRNFGLEHTPLWIFSIAGLALLAAMALATFLPARRAATVDPMQALRTE